MPEPVPTRQRQGQALEDLLFVLMWFAWIGFHVYTAWLAWGKSVWLGIGAFFLPGLAEIITAINAVERTGLFWNSYMIAVVIWIPSTYVLRLLMKRAPPA